MTSKYDLVEKIYKLECRINDLEYALIQAGVFNYNDQPMYNTPYGALVINKIGKK